ncbi:MULTISPECIES: PQQ-binding-like beta-propeller repeat protein [Halorussus]|uniref:beta-alanine-activating enzyme beta-propeller domain-containing protein n=1 Tax=Halorussus TaxID=1070314 RepID=UPI00209EA4CC|nr:PQQ-binding-like beta-propeller repeat protein [Halorussus vallis]USZ74689.1 PQQ-binding-like beta-propeller repeat protein [Halorussus vallis]
MGIEKVKKEGLAGIVMRLWEERGYQTKISKQGSETFVLAKKDRQNSKKELVWVRTKIVSAEGLKTLSKMAKRKGFNAAYCVSTGGFEDKAIQIAKETGVKCVNESRLRTFLQKHGLQNLVHKTTSSEAIFDNGFDSDSSETAKERVAEETPEDNEQSDSRRDFLRKPLKYGAVGLTAVAALGALSSNSNNEDGFQIRKQWSFETNHDIVASPVVSEDYIYIGSKDGRVYSINRHNGEKKWEFDTEEPIETSLGIRKDTIYVNTGGLNVYALNANNGKKRWSFKTNGYGGTAPVVHKDAIYVGSIGDTMYALNAENGRKRWSYKAKGGIISTPIVKNGVIYFGSLGDTFYAVDTKDGSEKWQFKVYDQVQCSPAVTESTVYFGTTSDKFYAVNSENGTQRWRTSLKNGVYNNLITVVDDTILVPSSWSLFALNANDGSEKWKFQSTGSVSGAVVSKNRLYLGSHNGNVHVIDAQAGNRMREYAIGGSVEAAPIVRENFIYVGSTGDSLYSLEEYKE